MASAKRLTRDGIQFDRIDRGNGRSEWAHRDWIINVAMYEGGRFCYGKNEKTGEEIEGFNLTEIAAEIKEREV